MAGLLVVPATPYSCSNFARLACWEPPIKLKRTLGLSVRMGRSAIASQRPRTQIFGDVTGSLCDSMPLDLSPAVFTPPQLVLFETAGRRGIATLLEDAPAQPPLRRRFVPKGHSESSQVTAI